MHHVGLFIQALIATEAAFSRIFALSTHIEGKVNAICSLHGQVHRQSIEAEWSIHRYSNSPTAAATPDCSCAATIHVLDLSMISALVLPVYLFVYSEHIALTLP